MAEDLNGPFNEICARLDMKYEGYGSCYDVLQHFGKKSWEIRSQFETHDGGPSVALFDWLRTAKPKMTVKKFNHVLIKRGINRKDIILLLKGFDLSQ